MTTPSRGILKQLLITIAAEPTRALDLPRHLRHVYYLKQNGLATINESTLDWTPTREGLNTLRTLLNHYHSCGCSTVNATIDPRCIARRS